MELIKSYTKIYVEAGCDEVGRGCLAGPVVAAVVVLGDRFDSKTINDSKQLTPKKRTDLGKYIKDHAIDFAIAELPVSFIDEYNILNASIQAMHLALDKLTKKPEFILVDGNRFKPYHSIPHQCIVKGDSKVLSIAAASIIAKNYRDDLMIKLHDEFPQYHWKNNMGYPTKKHRDAIREFGITPYHRKSFKLL